MGKAFALSTFPQARRRADLGGQFLIGEVSFLVVAPEASLAVKDGVGSVGILADLDASLDEMGAQRALGNLQPERLEPHAIVVADVSIFLNAQDLGQFDAGDPTSLVAQAERIKSVLSWTPQYDDLATRERRIHNE